MQNTGGVVFVDHSLRLEMTGILNSSYSKVFQLEALLSCISVVGVYKFTTFVLHELGETALMLDGMN